MINMDKLNDLIEDALWSGWIKGEKPISAMLIANPEEGKTTLLEQYSKNKGMVYMNDVTVWGITNEILPMITKGERINHIIVPDFLNILNKQQATSKPVLQFFNSVIEEGICKIKTYAIQIDTNVQFGLITAITKNNYMHKKKSWESIGFLSRLLPVTYKHSLNTAQEIFSSIIKEDNTKKSINLDFPDEPQEVKTAKKFNDGLKFTAVQVASTINAQGYRLQKNLQTLLKAHALKKGRKEVKQEDLDAVLAYSEYINYKFNSV